jgi:hypothetical protein
MPTNKRTPHYPRPRIATPTDLSSTEIDDRIYLNPALARQLIANPEPAFSEFWDAVQVALRPVLNAIEQQNPSLKDDLRDSFNTANLSKLIQFWNEAIASYSATLIPLLESNYGQQPQTLAGFIRSELAANAISAQLSETTYLFIEVT